MPVRDRPYDFSKGMGALGEEEIEAVVEVLRSRSLFRYYGPDLRGKVAEFERDVAALTGAAHAVAVSSGTAALQAALVGLGVEEGDEVVVPAVTFIATVAAVVACRAVPVFAEVDATLGLDPSVLSETFTDKTRVVIPVHLQNVACDMDAIVAATTDSGLRVLEDAAQAMGVTYRGRAVGSIGDAGAFSLQLEKNITAGEGGVVVTSDAEVCDRVARYQDQGGQFTTSKGEVRGVPQSGEPFIGTNLRMTELAGAVAGVQLGRLPAMIERMREIGHHVRAEAADLDLPWRGVPDPAGDGGDATLVFESADRAREVARALRAEGIPAGRLYNGAPVYANPAVRDRRTPWAIGCPWHCAAHPTTRTYPPGLCPQSERIIEGVVVIALGPRMSDGDAEDVVTALRRVTATR